MGDFIIGRDAPKDLMAVLRKYGMPERCTKFAITCDGPNEIILFKFEAEMRTPEPHETFEDVVETRVFKLQAADGRETSIHFTGLPRSVP